MLIINKSNRPQIHKTYVLQPKKEIKEEALEVLEVEEVKPKKKVSKKSK